MRWLRRFERWFMGEAPDPAMTHQTPRWTGDVYDYRKARAAFLRAQRRSETGRKLHRPAKVEPRKPAEVWRIDGMREAAIRKREGA